MRLFNIAAVRRSSPPPLTDAPLARWSPAVVAGLFLSMSVAGGFAEPADARGRSGRRHHDHNQNLSQRLEKKDKRPADVSGPLFAVVSIGDQHVSWYGADGLVARAPVSTGMRGHPTPTGIFSIIQKERMHHSNIYSGAPMPYMQRITWSGVAMHAGPLPGYPASHGCIRLPHAFAQRLYAMTRIGQRVIVSPREIAPQPVSHRTLPAPAFQVVEAAPLPGLGDGMLPEGGGSVEPVRKIEAAASEQDLSGARGAGGQRLNPIAYAQALKSTAEARLPAAAAAMKAAGGAVEEKTSEARRATADWRKAEDAVQALEQESAVLARREEKARDDKAQNEELARKGAEAAAGAEARLAEARDKVEAARRDRDAREAERREARRAADEAKPALRDAIRAARTGQHAIARREREARRAAKFVRAVEAAAKAVEDRLAEARARVAKAQGEAGDGEESAKRALEEAAAIEGRLAEVQGRLEAIRKTGEARDREREAVRAEAEAAHAVIKGLRELEVLAAQKENDIHDATKALKAAELVVKDFGSHLAETIRKGERAREELAQTDDLIAETAEARAPLEARLAEARKAADEALRLKETRDGELEDARRAVREAQAEAAAAGEALKEAMRRLEPVSILISRKTGRLYVRQAFHQIFEAPVAISQPDKTLGTHLFVAMRPDEAGAAMKWSALSFGSPAEPQERRRKEHSRRRSAREDGSETSAVVTRAPETALAALDRVAIPEETARKLAELAWVGSSVIITDYGISHETGMGTDFVILTHTRASAP